MKKTKISLTIVGIAIVIVILLSNIPNLGEQNKPSQNQGLLDTERANSYIEARLYISQENRIKLATLGADEASLKRVFDTNYVTDKNQAYWIFPYPRIVEGADIQTFKGVGDKFAIDKNSLYVTGVQAPGVDPATFVSVKGDSKYDTNEKYFKDKNNVFFVRPVNVRDDYRYELIKVVGADPKTARIIGSEYEHAKLLADDVHAYIENTQIPNIDGKTLKKTEGRYPYYLTDKNGTYFLDVENKKMTQLSSSSHISFFTQGIDKVYASIGDQVFFGTSTVTGANPNTFSILKGYGGYAGENEVCDSSSSCPYAADDNTVYYSGKKIEGADADTFTLIGYELSFDNYFATQPRYGRDQDRVYYNGEVVEYADPNTFVPLKSGRYYSEYGNDKKSVYWQNKLIRGADPLSFTIFEGQQPYEGCGIGRYSKDSTNVYYQNTKVLGADPNTFKPLGGSGAYSEDAYNFYKESVKANRTEYQGCDYH